MILESNSFLVPRHPLLLLSHSLSIDSVLHNNMSKVSYLHPQRASSFVTCLILSFIIWYILRTKIIEPQNPVIIADTSSGELWATGAPEPERFLRVSILNTKAYHDEVTAALLNTILSHGHIELSAYLHPHQWEMTSITDDFDRQANWVEGIETLSVFSDASANKPAPDILISVTCDWDFSGSNRATAANSLRRLLSRGETFLFCILHNAESVKREDWLDVIQP